MRRSPQGDSDRGGEERDGNLPPSFSSSAADLQSSFESLEARFATANEKGFQKRGKLRRRPNRGFGLALLREERFVFGQVGQIEDVDLIAESVGWRFTVPRKTEKGGK
jgi:hypothetical protein